MASSSYQADISHRSKATDALTLIWWYSTTGSATVDASDRGPMAQVMGRASVTIQGLSVASLAFSGRVNSTRICCPVVKLPSDPAVQRNSVIAYSAAQMQAFVCSMHA